MKLNTKIVKEMYQNKAMDNSFFEYILSTKGLPHTLYKDCSIGFPWGEWDRTALLIEELSYETNFFNNFKFKKDHYLVFNFLYFFPKESKKYLSDLWNEIAILHINDIKTILSVEIIATSIIEYLYSDFGLLKTKGIDEVKILYFLLAAQRYSLVDSIIDELRLIKYILNEGLVNSSYIKLALEGRMSNKREEPKLASLQKLRCALIISGQFREPIRNIDAIVKKIGENTQLEIKEIFVSSWKKVAGYNTSREDKFVRHLSPSLINKTKDGKVSISNIMLAVKDRMVALSEEEIYSNNNSSIPIKVALNNEDMYPYNNMSNPEKMYFNNALWIETLGNEYFEKNFDIIIKVRPDIEIINFKINDDIHNKVCAEEGWIFRRWGFGMGDQILIGGIKPMLKLLTCHKQKDICMLVKNLMDLKTEYWGHVNLAILAWKENIKVEKVADIKHIIKKTALIDESFIKNHLGFKEI